MGSLARKLTRNLATSITNQLGGAAPPSGDRVFWLFNASGTADLSGSDTWDSAVSEVWSQ